jgi:hypothetical protein
VYARRLSDRELTFDFARGLIDDNLLFVDRETGSLWSQLAGRAVSGEMEGTPLQAMPAMQTSWRFWKTRNPTTRVLSPPGESGHPYWYRDFAPGAPHMPGERTPPPTAHDTSTLGLGIVLADGARFFPLRLLSEDDPLKLTVDGRPLTIHHDAEGLTAWAEDGSGNLMMSVLAYQKSWLDFHPDSFVLTRED